MLPFLIKYIFGTYMNLSDLFPFCSKPSTVYGKTFFCTEIISYFCPWSFVSSFFWSSLSNCQRVFGLMSFYFCETAFPSFEILLVKNPPALPWLRYLELCNTNAFSHQRTAFCAHSVTSTRLVLHGCTREF